MKMLTRASLTLCLLACLTACTTLQGKETNGVYTSPDGEFSVMVPQILDVDAADGAVSASKRYVDFSMGGFYWTAEGAYSVEWYKLDKPYVTDADFIKDTREFLPSLVRDSINPSFKPLDIQELRVNGRAAVRLVAEGTYNKVDAYWVATSIDFGDRVGIALLMVPKKGDRSGPASAADAPNWNFYPAFTNSLTRH